MSGSAAANSLVDSDRRRMRGISLPYVILLPLRVLVWGNEASVTHWYRVPGRLS
jgi:hypothetical protein